MQFQLQVQNASGSGEARQIIIDVPTESDALRYAAKNEWRTLAIAPYQAEKSRSPGGGKFPLLQFSQELLALLEAGLNLTEAMTTLYAKESYPGVAATLSGMLTMLQQGQSFSDTLAAFPEIFPDIYIATVRAAERSGDMPEALTRYIGYQLQFDSIKKKLVSAAIYPLMLLVVGGFVTLFLLGYVC